MKGNECILMKEGLVRLPAIEPGETGRAHMDLPANFFQGDILELEAYDKNGHSICNWTWPVKFAKEYFATQRMSYGAADTRAVLPLLLTVKMVHWLKLIEMGR